MQTQTQTSQSPQNPNQSTKGAGYLVAGAAAGLINCFLFQPFEVIKTRLQQPEFKEKQENVINTSKPGNTIQSTSKIIYSQNAFIGRIINRYVLIKDIIRREGFFVLWRGSSASIIRNVPGFSLYFTGVSKIRESLTAFQQNTSFPLTLTQINLISGGATRGALAIAAMPITVIKVRYESNVYKYKSIAEAGRDIYKNNGGIRGFFVGVVPTILRDSPFAAIYVPVYEHFKKKLPEFRDKYLLKDPSNRAGNKKDLKINFISGILAGTVATGLTNPFDVVKTRVQLWQPNQISNIPNINVNINSSKRLSGWQTFILIFKTEGVFGFTSGILPRILKKSLSSAVAWSLYEEFVTIFKKTN